MKLLRWMSAGFALLLGVVYANAQAQGSGSSGGIISGRVGVVSPSPTNNAVKGAPFSADVVEESDQALVDGNHIRHKTQGRVFRDSEGRTRQENELPTVTTSEEKRMRVIIMDPVQQLFISLDPQNKVATVSHLGLHSLRAAAPANKPVPAPSVRSGVPTPPTQEDLGTMEIEGFVATGTRHTRTIEAGKMGNDKPLVLVSEIWFSNDVKETLLTKSESPQSGQQVRRLVNIHLGEPDPSLFEVPPDYTVKDRSQ